MGHEFVFLSRLKTPLSFANVSFFLLRITQKIPEEYSKFPNSFAADGGGVCECRLEDDTGTRLAPEVNLSALLTWDLNRSYAASQ